MGLYLEHSFHIFVRIEKMTPLIFSRYIKPLYMFSLVSLSNRFQ